MKHPRAAVGAAILSIVWGAITLLSAVSSVPVLLVDPGSTTPGPGDFALRPFLEHPAYLAYAKVMTVLGALAALALLGAGVQMLRLRPWARKLGIGWAVWSVVTDAVSEYLTVTIYLPAMKRSLQESGLPATAAQAGLWTGWGAVGLQMCFNLVIPAILLGLLLRPSVAEAFRTGRWQDLPADPLQPRKA